MNTNQRVGSYYLLGAGALGWSAWATAPWGYLLFWPTLSLLLVSMGYFKLGRIVYFKQQGQHPAWARTLHWFTLYGHELSRRIYARQCEPWDTLLPNLLIGRQLKDREVEQLKSEGVTAVLDLTAEFSEPAPLREMDYYSLPIMDLTAPSDGELECALEFIDAHTAKGKVYVHCKIGYSRTAAVAGSYLLSAGYAHNAGEAIEQLVRARPTIVVRPEAKATIERYAVRCLPS